MILKERIHNLLSGEAKSYRLTVKDEVTSTNTVLKEAAKSGLGENSILIANRQTAGRGRLGRSFFSPENTGIYMSILFFKDIPVTDAVFITTSAAVAAAKAIEKICKKKAEIKWVNDIYIDGKKVCGILTEAQTNVKTGKLYFAVLGIGVNVFMPENEFPAEIREIASSVMECGSDENIMNLLAAEILNNVCEYISDIKSREYIEEYKRRSMLTGREVYVIKGDTKTAAKAIEIDNEARLIVEYDNGEKEALSFGEVSVKRVVG